MAVAGSVEFADTVTWDQIWDFLLQSGTGRLIEYEAVSIPAYKNTGPTIQKVFAWDFANRATPSGKPKFIGP